jgi:ABC-type Fe3+/spermidine/putrescine transport system ATPase subunit
LGRPFDLYRDPKTLFVADFIGKANLFPVHLDGRDAKSAKVTLPGNQTLAVERGYPLGPSEVHRLPPDADGLVVVRPEHMEISAEGEGVAGKLRRVEFLGSFFRYIVDCPAATGEVVVDDRRGREDLSEGCEAILSFQAADARLFFKESQG